MSHYIDDVVGTASCSKIKLHNFANFVNNFHQNLKFTWATSDDQLPFLDLSLKPTAQGLATTIHYKETDSHSHLTYSSSHPVHQICSDENDFNNKTRKWLLSSYTTTILQQSSIWALQHVCTISQEAATWPSDGASTNKEVIPLILTFNPTNIHAKNILTKNFELLKSDPQTMEIFCSSRGLGVYPRNSNLKTPWSTAIFSPVWLLGKTQMEPFSVAIHIIRPAPTSIQWPRSTPLVDRWQFDRSSHVPLVTSSTSLLVVHAPCVTSAKLDVGSATDSASISDQWKKKADLPIATDDMMVSMVRTGFRDTLQPCSAQGRLIFKCQTLQPGGMNIDFSFIYTFSAQPALLQYGNIRAI